MFDEMFFVGFLSRKEQCDRNRAERNTVSVTRKNKNKKQKGGGESAVK